MKIRDSVAFVTGANRGLGLAFVQELLAVGARKVYAAARDPKGITLPGAIPVSLDVTKPESVAAATRAFSDVNLLINNAGICYWSGFFEHDALEVARSEMETLRTALRGQGTHVVGVHAGPIDTDMASQLIHSKITPIDVGRQVFSAIETRYDEVIADEITRQVKSGLSSEPGIYLSYDPARDLETAA